MRANVLHPLYQPACAPQVIDLRQRDAGRQLLAVNECAAKGQQGTCNGCVCCCFDGGSGIVSYEPTNTCTCARVVKSSMIWATVVLRCVAQLVRVGLEAAEVCGTIQDACGAEDARLAPSVVVRLRLSPCQSPPHAHPLLDTTPNSPAALLLYWAAWWCSCTLEVRCHAARTPPRSSSNNSCSGSSGSAQLRAARLWRPAKRSRGQVHPPLLWQLPSLALNGMQRSGMTSPAIHTHILAQFTRSAQGCTHSDTYTQCNVAFVGRACAARLGAAAALAQPARIASCIGRRRQALRTGGS